MSMESGGNGKWTQYDDLSACSGWGSIWFVFPFISMEKPKKNVNGRTDIERRGNSQFVYRKYQGPRTETG